MTIEDAEVAATESMRMGAVAPDGSAKIETGSHVGCDGAPIICTSRLRAGSGQGVLRLESIMRIVG